MSLYTGSFTAFSGIAGGYTNGCNYTGTVLTTFGPSDNVANCGPHCQATNGCSFFSFVGNSAGSSSTGTCSLFTSGDANGPYVASNFDVCGYFGTSSIPNNVATATTTTTTATTTTVITSNAAKSTAGASAGGASSAISSGSSASTASSSNSTASTSSSVSASGSNNNTVVIAGTLAAAAVALALIGGCYMYNRASRAHKKLHDDPAFNFDNSAANNGLPLRSRFSIRHDILRAPMNGRSMANNNVGVPPMPNPALKPIGGWPVAPLPPPKSLTPPPLSNLSSSSSATYAPDMPREVKGNAFVKIPKESYMHASQRENSNNRSSSSSSSSGSVKNISQ
ncbi:hypothetical protein HK100_009287 [Physocladia obscura]|uniref:Apple domain-containing protein n=1 Tax=Physocladia obscura TaxID=109957 RepID=A0AAD5T4I4_9FUNG|nr:hypothetical protein HK100_009287 [Physocladia obscura]